MHLFQRACGVNGLLQLYVKADTVDIHFGNVAFYFFNLYVVVDALYFILILVHVVI